MKTLIFDFDGTIADSFEIFLEVFEAILKPPRKLSPQEVKQLRALPPKQIFKYFKFKSWQTPWLVLRTRRLLKARMGGAKPFADIPDVIKQLHQNGQQMFILSTNRGDIIAEFLKTNGLDDCFVKIYGDISILSSKYGTLKKIVRQQKLDKNNCVYIGDEVRDIEPANKAGIQSLAVAWGFNSQEVLHKAGPTAMARQPAELLKILSE